MSSQVPHGSPGSEPASHGGAMDPNAVRLQHGRTQQPSASPTYSANSPSRTTSENASHGGSMDPNQTRLQMARAQQNSNPSMSAANNPGPHYFAASPGQPSPPPLQPQQLQYGSNAHLIGAQSPTAGITSSQGPQSPQSVGSASYFPAQNSYQQPYPMQVQQSFQGHQTGLTSQVCCLTRMEGLR